MKTKTLRFIQFEVCQATADFATKNFGERFQWKDWKKNDH
jgi:hypothetical protein